MSNNDPYAGPQGGPPHGSGGQPQGYGGQPAPYGQQPYYGQPQQFGGMPGWRPELANWGQRVGAFIIDALVILPAYLLLIPAIVMMSSTKSTTQCFDATDASSCYTAHESSSTSPLAYVLLLAGYAVLLGIEIWNRWIKGGKGQSIGKKMLGISLISESTGRPIGGGMAFVRDLAHILDSLSCYIGYLWPLWDDKRQTFSDKVMSTLVIQGPPPGDKC